MQASLESEAKGRAELMRMKKKLESDINELEIALDHANKANVDAQKNIRKYQDQIKELQVPLINTTIIHALERELQSCSLGFFHLLAIAHFCAENLKI